MWHKLTCIGQARVIGGNRKTPHVCTIALDEDTGSLLRVCLPFDSRTSMPIRRWSKFEACLYQASADSRKDSYFIDEAHEVVCEEGKASAALHNHLLSLACDEQQLVEEQKTIGVKKVLSMKLHFRTLTDKHRRHKDVMKNRYYLWYSNKLVYVSGEDLITNNGYNRQLLDWQIAEALRRNRHQDDKTAEADLRERIKRYKAPYLITGTTLQRRKNFMAISVLSAPKPYC